MVGVSSPFSILGNADIMNNTYTYDNVSNVKGVTNTGVAANGLGGAMVHNYGYDDLYRLSTANGTFTGANGKTANYTLAMGYDNLHNITSKKQDIMQIGVQFAGTLKAGYNLSYSYANNPQQISNIADTSYRTESAIAKTAKLQNYSYDANGNLLCVITGTKNTDGKLIKNNERKLLWDEENRLLALSDNGFVSNYWYDAAGERTVKTFGDAQGVSVNGVISAATTGTTNFTAYISPYMVVNNGGNYSKHIYIGSQRITSKVSDSGIFGTSPVTTSALQSKYAMLTAKIKTRYDSLGVTYQGIAQTGGLESKTPSAGSSPYFYHSDHLGSSSLITDGSGAVTQHLEYVPFGDVFVDERRSASSWTTPYLFSAKERDEETGLTYFGARYYDSRTSVWLSVDPLAEKFPSWSPYVYCFNNPVKLIDPTGKAPTPAEAARMAAHVYGDKQDNILAGGWRVSNRDFGLTSKDLNNSSTGLKSAVYERVVKGKVTEYTYATAGTEASWKDVGADVKQPIGLSQQYEKSVDNAKQISNIIGSTELTFTGHSLGGGEAALNALVTDRSAVTFNAAGISDITKFAEGTWRTPFKSEAKIDAYIMSTDPLNKIQNNTSLPDVNGNRHILTPTDLPSIYNGHSMDNVLKNFSVDPSKYSIHGGGSSW